MEWQLGIAVNGVIALAYAAISFSILRPLVRTGGMRTNSVATATGFIFASCSAGHAGHLIHLAGLPVLSGGVETQAARLGYDVHMMLVDAATAVIAVVFFTLRAREQFDPQSANLYEDAAAARRHALRVNEEVVQGLALAAYLLEDGQVDRARDAVSVTLEHARGIVSHPFEHDLRDGVPDGLLLSASDGT